jgi:large subunit ribosomal protein L30
MLKITLTSGLVGKKDTQRKVVSALGLGKYGSTVVHADTPTIQGMLRKVHHLVTVVQDGDAKAAEKKTAKKAVASGGASKTQPKTKAKAKAESK